MSTPIPTSKEDIYIVYLHICRIAFNWYTDKMGMMRVLGESYESLCNRKGVFLKAEISQDNKLTVNITLDI